MQRHCGILKEGNKGLGVQGRLIRDEEVDVALDFIQWKGKPLNKCLV